MKFEVVDLFPMYGKKGMFIHCTAHVYLIDFQFDIRGWQVRYSKKKDALCYTMPPMGEAIDEDGNFCRYPLFSSMSKEYDVHEHIEKALLEEAKKRLKTFKFPKDFPRCWGEYMKLLRAAIKKEGQD